MLIFRSYNGHSLKYIVFYEWVSVVFALRTNWNDAGMVAFSGFLYRSLIEMFLLNVEDLITEKGKINKEFVMP